jgi:hypothetical protein
VLRCCERDKKFAQLVAAKAKRVSSFQKKSKEVVAKLSPSPTPQCVDIFRRCIWEFSEELRLATLAVEQAGAE